MVESSKTFLRNESVEPISTRVAVMISDVAVRCVILQTLFCARN